METFIDRVIVEIRNRFGDDLRKVCIIFPTRRACLIFRNRLAATLNKPVWAPGVLGIGDFVSKHSKYQVSEEIPLLLTLFEVYKKEWQGEDFSKFYAWGKMLINDFDEIDKQLNDPSRIFLTIGELKKIDASFLPEPESLKWIHEFIASIDEEKLSKIKEQFARTWNRLKHIYTDYNQLLDKKGMAYEGKAYREIISKIKNNEFRSPWNQFVFAGFYGFSRIEERLIRELQQNQSVEVLWDADPYYIDNKIHEAGYYFRKSLLCEENFKWVTSHFDNSTKQIEITGIPLQAGQAKYAGELLSKLQASGKLNINSTALILPDENMLFPVLYSIPSSVEPINVTMGYPLEQSQYQELIKVLHAIQKNSRINSSGEPLFHHRYVRRLFNHPLLKGVFRTHEKNENGEFSYYLDVPGIGTTFGFQAAPLFFPKIISSEQVFDYLENILAFLRDTIISEAGPSPHFEDKVVEFILLELRQLKEHVQDHFKEIAAETAWQMARECISGLKVPFSGEPVHGLQVMGFLETRALDFQTIIILSTNEGILPASSVSKSFIPFSIRKGYGLSTYEDQDASWSYHFYRLLHHAENIYLLYNSEVSKTNGGEPSRYLLQIKQELSRVMGNRLKITHNYINTPIHPDPIAPVSVPKLGVITDILQEYKTDESGLSKRNFSSSAITTYISCSLRFYYQYIAGLKEKDSDEETIEDYIFGSILHKALEILYNSVGENIDKPVIDQLISKTDEAVNKAVKEIYKMRITQLEGTDILLTEVIRELTRRILEADKKDTPFRISGLEKMISGTFNSGQAVLGVHGSIDRLDEKDGIARIIDYKTGKVDLKSSDMHQLFSRPDKKALFQLYFYALLHKLNYPDKPVKTGFYLARNLGSGIAWLEGGNTVSDELLNEFNSLLRDKLTEIMNPETGFTQTTDIKQCRHCAYKILCNR